jgi:hypothetical protein
MSEHPSALTSAIGRSKRRVLNINLLLKDLSDERADLFAR